LLVLEYEGRDERGVSICPIKEGSQGGQGMGIQGFQVDVAETGLVEGELRLVGRGGNGAWQVGVSVQLIDFGDFSGD